MTSRKCLTRRLWLALLPAFVWAHDLQAATHYVGSSFPLKRPSDAAKVAKAGDLIIVSAGTYSGDVAVWTQARLKIEAAGGPVVIDAAGKSAEGKAAWVMRGGDFEVKGIEFRGARVADRNGAGIRFESGKLTVRNCVFRNNQVGILTSNNPDARLHVFDSQFFDVQRERTEFFHLLYAGRIKELSVRGSRFHNGFNGHLLKSRAARTDLRYNLFVDGPVGQSAYEAEFPNGGRVVLIGNVFGEAEKTENPFVVSYGVEGAAWPDNVVLLSHNTFFSNARFGGVFLRVANKTQFAPPVTTALVNNLYVFPGWPSYGASGVTAGNWFAFRSMVGDLDALDFALPNDSWLRGRVDPAPEVSGEQLAPSFEFEFPLGTRPLTAPERWAPGAFQTPSTY